MGPPGVDGGFSPQGVLPPSPIYTERNPFMFQDTLAPFVPNLTETQAARFARYYAMLVEWNEKVNLTAITEETEVAQKHFADSLLPATLLPRGAKCIDVGTGAGFPGVPLLILRSDLRMTLLDSLNKRLVFLQALLEELGLEAQLVHARAEDAGRDPKHRDKYDVALTRAVAGTSPLVEWTLPLVKEKGVSLMYKGPKAEEELKAAHNAITLLRGQGKIIRFDTPWGERNIIAVTKLAPTPKAYPRKAGTAAKQPL